MALEGLPYLYKRAKRDRARVLQPRLEELVSRKPNVKSAAWRQLFKFLELQQVGGRASRRARRATGSAPPSPR